jgi:hypothetical protein
MKYTEEQKERLVTYGKRLYAETQKKIDAINKDFPINVITEDGFYIVESKMNTL